MVDEQTLQMYVHWHDSIPTRFYAFIVNLVCAANNTSEKSKNWKKCQM